MKGTIFMTLMAVAMSASFNASAATPVEHYTVIGYGAGIFKTVANQTITTMYDIKQQVQIDIQDQARMGIAEAAGFVGGNKSLVSNATQTSEESTIAKAI